MKTKNAWLFSLLLFMGSLITHAQELNQTVRGTVVDTDSRQPVAGADVVILGTSPLVGTITDNSGNFRLESVAVGRINLQVSYLGYEMRILPNIEVNSGKEVLLNIYLSESTEEIDEVVVKANARKGEAMNEMALVSARSITVEESKRYAGGFDDPSRVVSNFAGVSNTADGSSDIIVRGNSPKYMQWYLEGNEISSPYHFNDQNTSFGGLSMLNNKLLTTSDFYTGAFAPEYGNVLSSVFDVRMRQGNNEKLESSIGFGLIGTDITLEGPFRKGYGGSFLVNYRYSTSSLLQDIGLLDMEGLFNFQDANMKIVLPTKKAGSFTLFGVGGASNFYIDDLTPAIYNSATEDTQTLLGSKRDYDKGSYVLNTGLNHIISLSESSFLKTSLLYSADMISDEIYLSDVTGTELNEGKLVRDSTYNRRIDYENHHIKSVIGGEVAYHNKINAKHKIQVGLKYKLYKMHIEQNKRMSDENLINLVDTRENISTAESYVSWKYRPTPKVTFVSGFHNINVFLTGESTIEPRIAMNWQLNSRNSLHLGYGNHSNLESAYHYFVKVNDEDGNTTEPNRDLEMLRANHYVAGYERRFTEKLRAKLELYYQDLYNLPVENNDTSYFATINEGLDYKYVDLVNAGRGKNYGAEITLERFFDNHYYFLINASVFNSTYKPLDGKERNTRYNKSYLGNILVGKEFHNLGKKDNQTLSINFKMFFEGGQRYIPLLQDENGNIAVDPDEGQYYDYSKAFDDALESVYQINLSVSYKFNRSRTTHEIFLDLQNLTNHKAKIYEYYDESEPNKIGYQTQFGFFPNIQYRVYF